MSDADAKPSGFFATLRRIGSSVLALGESRLQLFALELQTEKLRLVDLLVWLSFGLALGAVGLLLGTLALAIFLWRTTGYLGLLVAMGVFLGVAALVLHRLKLRVRQGPLPFADSIAEFKKDRACLGEQE